MGLDKPAFLMTLSLLLTPPLWAECSLSAEIRNYQNMCYRYRWCVPKHELLDKAEVLLPFNFLRSDGLFSRINQTRWEDLASLPLSHLPIAVGQQGINNTCKVSLVFIGSFQWPDGVHGITSSNLFIWLMSMPGSIVTADSSQSKTGARVSWLSGHHSFILTAPVAFLTHGLRGFCLVPFLHVLCSQESLGVSPICLLAMSPG